MAVLYIGRLPGKLSVCALCGRLSRWGHYRRGAAMAIAGRAGVLWLISLVLVFFAGSRFRGGLLALPLCGAAVTFFAAAKKVTKESSSRRPRSHAVWPCLPAANGTRLSVTLKGPAGLGSRTVCGAITLSALVQHEIASAQRYALPLGMQGKPVECECSGWKRSEYVCARKPD